MPSAVTMYQYHAWANQTLLNRISELPSEVYTQEVKSIFPTVAKGMAHIYAVDYTWLEILNGVPMPEALITCRPLEEEAEQLSIQELSERFRLLSERYEAFFRKETDLERTVLLDNPYVTVRETSLAEMVLQVVNHATYHRGNVSAMLRQMGHASTMTEYALFWYMGGAQDTGQAAPAGRAQ
ncbi:DinB family protein [Paenibacillus mucilaginosus]|uniref:DNA damage-inducible protein DinB n=2 Tax=Paenibacillus mucilaginosus TaxID=61624 RepID=I0BH24_9BACL|nr:DinB family protein [Paenibacillus mucilaginosus]AEI40906.1 DinB [Paenibacillus mucilaginosus KNP414]AFH61671.1 DNA damage-inducible protein DinB [Paenibacillus mucilaginosus K02]MCG7211634.1 DinB family protein [Paenibacillus mucilaginosus]WDM30007.1 DinB family protein [Paenibacillus mucilaginosus]